MNDKLNNRKRVPLRIALAGLAVIGIGAAVTSAVWTDDVFFGATATSSSFDLQGRALPTDSWSDIGVPGDTTAIAPIVIPSAALDGLSPDEVINVPFQLCNDGNVAGTVTAVSDVTITGALAADPGLTAVVTAPVAGVTPLPLDGCATPVVGNLEVTTTAAFALQGATGELAFNITGTSD